MEKLFTKKQLSLITAEAESNTESYLDTRVIDGNATEISILTVSLINQLIFVEGNSDTGFEHLRERHSYFSFENYWTLTDSDRLRLDDPGKFNPKMMPIIDWVKIADAIYCDENKNITKNNNPEMFDKYTGNFTYNDQDQKYHLITYKNTKIVHSLFPEKKQHNRKRKCKFGKGIVTSTLKFPPGLNDLIVPYNGPGGITAYSILVRKYYKEQVERTFIQKHDKVGVPIEQYQVAERNFKDFEKFEREDLNYYQLGNLSTFEKIITKIDEQK